MRLGHGWYQPMFSGLAHWLAPAACPSHPSRRGDRKPARASLSPATRPARQPLPSRLPALLFRLGINLTSFSRVKRLSGPHPFALKTGRQGLGGTRLIFVNIAIRKTFKSDENTVSPNPHLHAIDTFCFNYRYIR